MTKHNLSDRCGGKTCYSSHRKAHTAIRLLKRGSGTRSDLPNRAYHCDDCGFWHITSLPSYNKDKRRRNKHG